MAHSIYRLTLAAEKNLDYTIRETTKKWGLQQAKKYHAKLVAGFQYIADHHTTLYSSHRAELADGTAFSLYLVEHHYVAYAVDGADTVIIAGLFHESMDIPRRLKQLQGITADEIKALKNQINQIQ